MEKSLPPIPAKRYFTIGEVSELCGVKPYVLRYWEQEFSQLKPMKRRGNRRYYQHHEVLLIRRIRELLYEQGFTISGARNRLSEAGVRAALAAEAAQVPTQDDGGLPSADEILPEAEAMEAAAVAPTAAVARVRVNAVPPTLATMRDELVSIRQLLLP
ncbi:MAG: MerR family transcriptional regulator [Methylibium sp.]|uniref:Putative transcriptional regulator n=1 Tax=Methylibium petroleiphilum (strain ATCC BAA-1232 / LMG 22953 / PM1) TaxID=420662 RepID=A2SH00_METPP|nr:MerR family transcriptional regulator [Methylibium petroleiphilum]ABM94839.1 putative transcriptional regulator [Methylibium petroleiphilum PM1]MBN9203819.1 MerR family transcriptional regulator [Methylibium petroleiphilum]